VTSISDRTSIRTPAGQVVGRGREVELLEAALASGAHVVLEGPPGTGKSTLLRRVAADRESTFVLVEGNAELTPARLVGHFDPALVLERGYRPEVFVDGPLLEAMRDGGLLYVEELNRVPEETLNVLLTVMSERELNVPRLGRVAAHHGFRLVAAMNPYDTVGTARISSAVHDRTCRIVMGYQSAQDEHDITALSGVEVPPEHRAAVVGLVRATRSHPDIRVGSSVRGAIDVIGISSELARRRGVAPTDWQAGLDAALVALSGRIRLGEACTRTAEDVITALWVEHFGRQPDPVDDGDTSDPGRGGGSGEA